MPANSSSKVTLITGAKGFLGRHMARLCADHGEYVVGIGHGDWRSEGAQAWGMQQWHASEITLDSLTALKISPAKIIHCAGGGSVSDSISQPLADFERTVTTTAHVLEYVRLYAPECRVVYPSSAGVYGRTSAAPIVELQAPAPISQYGIHKLMCEQMLRSYGREYGISVAIVRLFSVYGCELRKQLLWDACCKFSRGEEMFMGTGEEIRDWLHVEDGAMLLLHAAERASSACPLVNGGSGKGISVRELLCHLGRKTRVQKKPTFSGLVRRGDPDCLVADIATPLSWGWAPARCWEEGVEEYVRWWEEQRG